MAKKRKGKKPRSAAQIAATKRMLAGLKAAKKLGGGTRKKGRAKKVRSSGKKVTSRKRTKKSKPTRNTIGIPGGDPGDGTRTVTGKAARTGPIMQKGKQRGHFTFPRAKYVGGSSMGAGPDFFGKKKARSGKSTSKTRASGSSRPPAHEDPAGSGYPPEHWADRNAAEEDRAEGSRHETSHARARLRPWSQGGDDEMDDY